VVRQYGYENPGANDSSEAVRAMARRLVETRQWIRNRDQYIADLLAERAAARHAGHRAWRRWRLTHRLASHAYVLGLISSSGVGYGGGGCNGCLTAIGWRGRRPYILGWRREQWSCLLVGRHRRREVPGEDICAVCAPCWVCRSTDPLHDAWECGNDREQRRIVDRAIAQAGDAATRVVLCTRDGAREVDAIRTACAGLFATPLRLEPGAWTLTHERTGLRLRADVVFDSVAAAQTGASRLAATGLVFTTDPRDWNPDLQQVLFDTLAELDPDELGPDRLGPDGLGRDEPGTDELAPAAGARR
jgi:hypothetical protein